MSLSTELPSMSPIKPDSEARKILGLGGNRVKVLEEQRLKKKKKKEEVEVTEKPKSLLVKGGKTNPGIVVLKINESVDSSCSSRSWSSSSSSNGPSVKTKCSKRREKHGNNKLKSEGHKGGVTTLSLPLKQCDWITQFSDPLHISFHDEEWGVPVHEDRKLFELLVLSQASAELTWSEILHKRDKFRKLFEDFDPLSIAKFSEEKLSARPKSSTLLSEQKLRAVVGNANQLLKIQQEFGSFSTYCWRFMNHKPIRNGFRYARQVPAKTPKSELISKDLMKRGFRCVGPTVIYSFMQVSGMVNDHLISCFRYVECNNAINKDTEPKPEETKVGTARTLKDANVSHD